MMKLSPSPGLGLASGGLFSPDWAWLKQQTMSQLSTLGTRLRTSLLGRGSYRHDKAQAIRDAAGVPATETAGIPGGVTVGSTGSLTSERNQTLSDETAVSTFASSGTGTLLDPYIIEDLHFDAQTGGTATALFLNDPDATYYVKVRNCKFSDYTGNYIILNFGTKVELENITFDSATAITNGIRIDKVGATINNFHVPGLAITNLINVNASDAVDITMRYLKLDNSVRDWTGTGRLLFFNNYSGPGITFDIQYVDADFSATTVQPFGLLYGGDADVDSIIYNNVKWRGGKSAMYQLAAGGVPLGLWSNIEMLYCDVAETTQEAVRFIRADNIKVAHGTYVHSTAGAGYRVVHFDFDAANSGHACSNVEAHHLKITKSSGTFVAGNEALQARAAGGTVHFDKCWITDATEDAVEFVYVRSGETYIASNIVADSVRGQIVDVARTWDEGTWAETTVDPASDSPALVYNIYGDCQERVVKFSGVRGGIAHSIFADNSASTKASVSIEDWTNTAPNYKASKVFIAGPLPLAADQGTGGAAEVTATGTDTEIRHVDENGVLQTIT